MKRTAIFFIFLLMTVTVLVLGVSCSTSTPNAAFVAPVQTVSGSNPTWTFTPTYTATPSPTSTPVFPVSGFNSPYGLAIDSTGKEYVGDNTNNGTVWQYIGGVPNSSWPNGRIKTDGLSYTSPKAIAADSLNNIYVVGNGIAEVSKYDNSGNLQAQYMPTGLSTNHQGVACAVTNLYVSDSGNKQIFSLNLPQGTLNTTFNALNTPGTLSTSYIPYGLAANSSGTTIFVVGSDSSIHIYTSAGGAVTTITGFSSPYAVALDSTNNLYVSDTGNHQVEEFTVGNYLQAPYLIFGVGTLQAPEGIAIDSSNNVYVVDSTNNIFYEFSPTGSQL